MIVSALFQFGLGMIIINRKADQEILVKKEMKHSFLNYGLQSRQSDMRWIKFEEEVSDLRLNTYAYLLYLPIFIFMYLATHIFFMLTYCIVRKKYSIRITQIVQPNQIV